MTRTNQLTSPHLRPDPADLNRLLAGEHHNPHAILGAHEYGDHTVIRAYRPHAVEVAALVGDERYVSSASTPDCSPWRCLDRPHRYRLQVSYQGGGDLPDVHTVADPYRFLPTLGELDLHLFSEGRHERLWEIIGAHPRSFRTADGVVEGVSFALWAPNAKGVGLIGEFNHWDGNEAPLRVLGPPACASSSGPASRWAATTSSACTALTALSATAPTRWPSPPRCRRVVGQRLDPASGQLTGEVQRLRIQGAPSAITNIGASNVAAGGGHVAILILHAGQFQLAWTDRTGAVQTRTGEPGAYREMDFLKDNAATRQRALVGWRRGSGSST